MRRDWTRIWRIGLIKGSLTEANKMVGAADNKTGVDMLLAFRIAPLIQGEHNPKYGQDY